MNHRPDPGPRSRIVVVSPHLDDGVLSLGAAIASWARRGARVELLTVFALEPDSLADAGGWDERAGFRTEGDAARGRGAEDAEACGILGAVPVWLPFGSVDYERHGDEEAVRAAVTAAVGRADALLLPGYPLSHPDHAWLARTLADARFGCDNLGVYAEQPYTRRVEGEPRVPGWVEENLESELRFAPVRTGVRDLLAKWRAIRRYRSQLPLLGMRWSLRRGAHTVLRPELVAWSSR